MTIRSQPCIDTTRLALTWLTPPGKWNLCMPNEGMKEMERDAVDYDIEQELEATSRPQPRAEQVHPSPPPRNRTNRNLIIAGALLVLIAGGLYLWIGSWNRVSTDDAQVDGHIIPVSSKIYGNVVDVLVHDN